MNVLLINVYYGGKILNTPTSVNYTNGATCTISISNNISFEDLRKQVHTNLSLPPSQYMLTIKTWINTTQLASGVYYHSLFCVSSYGI
jgi:hypothetical protein